MEVPCRYQHSMLAPEAWSDENHVINNRQMYREKFTAVVNILTQRQKIQLPAAGFYLWLNTPASDTKFARELYEKQNISVLPGSFLSREYAGINPGSKHIRIALVAPQSECVEAAERIKQLL